MPELNPRRTASRGGRFAQVLAAVLSGMAAMYVLQNWNAAHRYKVEAAALVEPAPAPTEQPSVRLDAPDGSPKGPKPAPQTSMLLKAEPNAADAGVVGMGDQFVPFKTKTPKPTGSSLPRLPSAAPAAEEAEELPPPPAPTPAPAPAPRLRERRMDSRYAAVSGVGIGATFQKPELVAPTWKKPEPAPAPKAKKKRAAAAVAAAETDAPPEPEDAPLPIIRSLAVIEATTAPAQNVVSPIQRPLDGLAAEYWTRGRLARTAAAAALCLLGVLYLLWASGYLSDAPPAREEGEL